MTNQVTVTAWIDATHGVAGDMLLGALVDCGVDLAVLQSAVDAVIPQTVRLTRSEVQRAGMRATKVTVEPLVDDHQHRGWQTIDHLIADADLEVAIKDRARATFRRIGEVEARAHGIALDDVHFHEVGAWDSIADIVGVCAGLVALGVDRVVGSPVALGNGMVRMAHGELAVPGPAIADLARGWPAVSGPENIGELTTPTGMALLRLGEPGPLPPLTLSVIGTGAGARDFPGHANVTRVLIGSSAASAGSAGQGGGALGEEGHLVPARPGDAVAVSRHDDVPAPSEHGERTMLACTVDDLDPRLWPGVLDRLVEAGADDAWLVPVLMRKGRPGHTLEVLTRAEHVAALHEIIYRHTSTLGIRSWTVHRDALGRDWVTVDVRGQAVRIKRGLRNGMVVNQQPEHADVAAAALALGCSELEILHAALSRSQPELGEA
ncbi:MAG: nickel pincer cofactor biosynthesis protein LarC [Propionibacteriaceae bacterium]|nr:nickel pincer cofactor biosynthesis protein LarC [Propionibacteriaceae bacterium]